MQIFTIFFKMKLFQHICCFIANEMNRKNFAKEFRRNKHFSVAHGTPHISHDCAAVTPIFHTHILTQPYPISILNLKRAQMPSGEIINVQSKIQVAHQDEAKPKNGVGRAMADFSFGISEKSQCTKST